jgi:hypothetical protein
MAETIAVYAIVGVVLILSGRSLYRALTGASAGCACADDCPIQDLCGTQNDHLKGELP